MFDNMSSTAKWLWILALLVVANVAYYLYNNWGLVTVKVTDQPLSKVIHSIEWQAWVKIYTNLPPDTKVTMWADHVPLAEAMETLAANVDVPPGLVTDDATRPRRNRTTALADQTGWTAADQSSGQFQFSSGSGWRWESRWARRRPRRIRRRWWLGPALPSGTSRFFVAPTAAQVRQEISNFETNDPGEENKVYTYGSQLQLISTESTATAPDPRLQTWPGYQPPAPKPLPNPADATQGNADSTPAADTPPNVQTYLESFAAAANVWIMAPGSWDR